MRASIAATRSSCKAFGTYTRRGASHHCPFNLTAPGTSCAATAVGSASSSTTAGLFPDSSRCTGTSLGAALAAMSRPVAVPPVKLITAMRGSATNALPTAGPPCTSWKTPGGKPASAACANSEQLAGAHSGAFRMTGQPTAKACAILVVATPSGAFQGTSTAAGPLGIRSSHTGRPSTLISRVHAPDATRATGATRVSASDPAIIRVTVIGTPVSRASACAMASSSGRNAAAKAAMRSARPSAPRSSQLPLRCTRSAAASARSRSAASVCRW